MKTPSDLSTILRRGTLLFLAVPQIIFFFGWLRLPYALVLGGLLMAAVWRQAFRTPAVVRPPGGGASVPLARPRNFAFKLTAAVVLPALVLTLLSGAGGWGGGDSDWLKHDTLLHDLVSRPWPVSYETARGPVALVYYLAYYLPAALLGKLTGSAGYQFASQWLALTTFVGIVLSAGWLFVLGTPGLRRSGASLIGVRATPSGAPLWIGAAVFFGFSGLDVLGKVLVNCYFHLPVFYGDWTDVEWWAQFAQYSSNAATVFWAPQHAFGGWLPIALLLDDWFIGNGEMERSWVLYLALALPWSPFAALGLAGVTGGLLFWRWMRHGRKPEAAGSAAWWRGSITLANAAGFFSGGIFALYLLAHFQNFYLPEAYRITPGHHPVPLLEQAHVPFPMLYLAFVGIEFAGLSLMLGLFLRRNTEKWGSDGSEAPLLIVATLVLLLLPCFHYGFANDLVMRGGIPALFVLQVLLVRMLSRALPAPYPHYGASRRPWPALIAALLLLAGFANVGLEYRRHFLRIVAQKSLRDARTLEPVRSLAELQRTVYARPGFDFARQYLGAADSVFARHLARKIERTPPAQPGGKVDF